MSHIPWPAARELAVSGWIPIIKEKERTDVGRGW
jgi:hypothetical protein